MSTFISKISLIITLVLVTKRISAQNYNDYRDAAERVEQLSEWYEVKRLRRIDN